MLQPEDVAATVLFVASLPQRACIGFEEPYASRWQACCSQEENSAMRQMAAVSILFGGVS
jgi:hypothetical protein